VLAMISDPETELISQSDSAVASWGIEGDKQRTHWFNMVAFDEEQMNAVRKYGFILEEVKWGWNQGPEPALRLDAAYVMEDEILNKPYSGNNEKRIEIFRAAHKLFSKDADELILDSRSFRNSTIMVKQAFNAVLMTLDHTPAFAEKLPLTTGMAFDHPTLGESYIRMLIEDDIVKIKIKSGKKWFKKWFTEQPFEEHPDVNYM
jgi:hypothetical protein